MRQPHHRALRFGSCCKGSHSVTCTRMHVSANGKGNVYTQRNTLPFQPKLVVILPALEGWKAESTLLAGYIPRWFTCPKTVTHLSINQIWCWLTFFDQTNAAKDYTMPPCCSLAACRMSLIEFWTSRATGWVGRLRNDLWCVEWDFEYCHYLLM